MRNDTERKKLNKNISIQKREGTFYFSIDLS